MNPIRVGETMPDFQLIDARDQTVTAADVKEKNGLVTIFVHGTWCPHCLQQFRRLNPLSEELAAEGVGLVCIAKDPLANVAAYQRTAVPPLRYPILADNAAVAAQSFGVYSAEYEMPFPALFYADAAGRIAHSELLTASDHGHDYDLLLEIVRRETEAA